MPRCTKKLALLFVLLLAVPAWTQAPVPPKAAVAPLEALSEVDRRIIAEANKGSEAMANLMYLSDVIGPRLTGSAGLMRANDWTADKMKSYGLSNVHLESWLMPEGWERGPASARLVEPNNGRSILLASQAWHPGTNGKIQADVVALKQDKDGLAELKGKLKGAVVLDGPPKTLKPLAELLKEGAVGVPRFTGKKSERSFEEIRALMQQRQELLQKEGVAVILRDAGKHCGLLYTTGGWRGTDRPSAANRTPSAYIPHNQYELLYRLATRQPGSPTRIEIDINNKFIPGPLAQYNTVGEITGSDKPDEFVICGAHLDSWDLALGSTDNGTGTCVVLEAARILQRSGIRPKRTIRFVLFTGEEQGMHGSRAYVEQHKDEVPHMSACIVHDTGPGKVLGLGTGSYPKSRETLEKQLGPALKAVGVTDFASRGGGGSDHIPFAAKDIPGLILRQVTTDYFLFTHHSQVDTLEHVREGDLIQGAQVMALTAMGIANLPELLPREGAGPRGGKTPGDK
jgi:carboxypeptidase Q